MFRKNLSRAFHHPTSWIFLFVLAASLVMAYARADPPLSSNEFFWLSFLSLVFLVVGTVIFIPILNSGTPNQKIMYLAFQIALGMLILYLGRGNGWLIMLPLASHSVALFSPREAILPCVIITLGIAWNTSQYSPYWIPFLQSAVVFGSAVFFAAVFTNISIRDARRREEIERLAARLEEANQTLRDYAVKVDELAVTQERNRLAREIHDGLGHYLTAMNMQVNLATAMLDQDHSGAKVALIKLQVMLLEALADVRRSVSTLRSDPLTGKNLPEALQPLVEESQAAGLVTELLMKGDIRNLPAPDELTLYRAVQEGLTNILKHAQARQVVIFLEYRPRETFLRIQDDGIGCNFDFIDLNPNRNNFGLFGLRERVQLLGGTMQIQTAPQEGFTIEIVLPVQDPYPESP